MTEKEEVCYVRGQQAAASLLVREIYRYLPEPDRDAAVSIMYLTECRGKVKEIFDYMDEEWSAGYDDLHLADVLEKLFDRVAALIDSTEDPS